jgi:hypothetical protein
MDKTEQSIKISDQFRDELGYFFRGQQEKRDNLPIMTGYVNELRDLSTQFAACAIGTIFQPRAGFSGLTLGVCCRRQAPLWSAHR